MRSVLQCCSVSSVHIVSSMCQGESSLRYLVINIMLGLGLGHPDPARLCCPQHETCHSKNKMLFTISENYYKHFINESGSLYDNGFFKIISFMMISGVNMEQLSWDQLHSFMILQASLFLQNQLTSTSSSQSVSQSAAVFSQHMQTLDM